MKQMTQIIKNYEHVSLMIDVGYEDWKKIYDQLEYQSIDCIYDLVNYRVSYLKPEKAKNLSLIFYSNKIPVAIVPIIIFNKKKNDNYDFIGFFPPSFDISIGKKLKLEIFKKYLDIINELKNKISIKLKFNISCFSFNDYEFLSFLYDNNFKIVEVNKLFIIKNKNSIEKIFADFRKSYKPLINSNIKKYKPKIMNCENFDEKIWLSFRTMHKKIVGKITRSSNTWNHQKKALKNNNAILVYLNVDDKFLGFSFFYYTNHESIYASAVVDEKTKDQKIPVGHLLQYEAINFFVKKNIKNYKITRQENSKKNSLKEENILKFKQGFANSFVKEFILKC